MGQILNPAYIFLNIFGLTLVAKLQVENHIRKSGINYTIIRPGGLRNEPPSGNLVMEPEVNTFIECPSDLLHALSCCEEIYNLPFLGRTLFMMVSYQGIWLRRLLLRH